MTDMNQDWKALSEAWQQQQVPGLDIDALRTEATRRGRTLRRVLWGEVGLTVLVVLVCGLILFAPDSDAFEQLLFGAMGVFLVGYQAWMIRMRLGEVDSGGLDGPSLLDLEMRRCRTTLRYWRIGMWTALALWLVLYGFFMMGIGQDWPSQRVAGLAGGLGVNVFVFPAMGVYGLWSCNAARKRLARYQALREQLQAA